MIKQQRVLIVRLMSLMMALCCITAIAAETPASPVYVTKAVKRNIPVIVEGTGHVRPYVQINVKSRVDGRIEKFLVNDGAIVKEGAVLIEIDRKPYKLAVKKVEAALTKAVAQQKESERLYQTALNLFNKSVIAKEQMQQKEAVAEEDKAQVELSKAELEIAKQNLSYCTITAPVKGILGRKLLDAGSLVNAYDDQIIVLNELDRIKVLFALPSAELRRVQKNQLDAPLTASISTPDMSGITLTGKLHFISNQIDPQTGMFNLQAEFDNTKHHFWPGQFVNVQLTLTTRPDTIAIPMQAITNGPHNSKVVYTVDNGKAKMQTVKTGWRTGRDMVILDGLDEGMEVVTEGIFKLYPGAPVKILTKDGQPKPSETANGKNQ